MHDGFETDHVVVVDLCEYRVNVHIGALGGDVHLHDVFDDALFKKVVFEHLERVVIGAFGVTNEQVILVEHHHVAPFDADGFAAFVGRKFVHPVEVDGFAIGF